MGENSEVDYESITFGSPGGRIVSSIEKKSVLRLLDRKSLRIVLDIGAATGRMSREVIGIGATVIGVDTSTSRIKLAHARARSSAFMGMVADGQFLPFRDEMFDSVICIRVLKYFPDHEGGVSEMSRVLKPWGILILELSNIFGYQAFWRLLTLRNIQHPTLFNFFAIQSLLLQNNLKMALLVPLHKIPTILWIKFRNPIAFCFLSVVESMLQRLTPPLFLSRGILLKCVKTAEFKIKRK